jgi:hypothetical protein
MAQEAGSDYLEHLSGLAAFMDWVRQNEKQGLRFEFEGSLVRCDARVSRRLAIGLPRSRVFGRHPFLAVQAPEALFLRLLRFGRATVSADARSLRLLAPALPGDGNRLPDLPALALELSIDSPQKGAELARANRLAARSLWFEEQADGSLEPQVGNRDVFWAIPLARQLAAEPMWREGEDAVAFSLQQWIEQRIEATNVYANPGYIDA